MVLLSGGKHELNDGHVFHIAPLSCVLMCLQVDRSGGFSGGTKHSTVVMKAEHRGGIWWQKERLYRNIKSVCMCLLYCLLGNLSLSQNVTFSRRQVALNSDA